MITSVNSNDTKIIKLLLKYGANINLQNNNGNTALMLIFLYCQSKYKIDKSEHARGGIIKLLIKSGINTTLKNKRNISIFDLMNDDIDYPYIISLLNYITIYDFDIENSINATFLSRPNKKNCLF